MQCAIDDLDWFFISAGNIFVLVCLRLAVSPLGKLRLGGSEATPDHTYLGGFSMLFAAGMGFGLLFFGVSEPLSHFGSAFGGTARENGLRTDWAPLGGAAGDADAANRLAMAATIHHPLTIRALMQIEQLEILDFLRTRLVAPGLPYDTPAAEIMSRGVVAVNHNQLVFEAMLALPRSPRAHRHACHRRAAAGAGGATVCAGDAAARAVLLDRLPCVQAGPGHPSSARVCARLAKAASNLRMRDQRALTSFGRMQPGHSRLSASRKTSSILRSFFRSRLRVLSLSLRQSGFATLLVLGNGDDVCRNIR